MIPDGWQVQNLEDVALIILGQSPPSSACNDKVKGYPFYQGNAEFGYRHPLPQRWIEKPLKVAKKDDILISVRAPVGELNIANVDCCIGRGIGAIRPLSVNKNFIYYTLLNARNSLASVSQGSTFDAINGKELRSLSLLIPPLPEQKKIAAILSSVDDAIQATQAVINQTRRVKQGLLQQLLTRGIGHTRFKQTEIGEIPEEWDVHQIGNLFKQVRKPVSVEKESHYQEIGIRSHGKGIFHKDKITGEKLGNKRVFWIEPNCLILNIVFAWERAVAVTNNQEKGMIASHRFPMFKPDGRRIQLSFIILYFHSLKGMHALGSISPGGAGRNKTLSQKAFLKLPIPVPPLVEQTRIAEAISKIDIALDKEQQKLESLNRTKRGLMQDLLTGRVRLKLDGEVAI
ncbi:MAG: restriction endonuclease subunit S [Proteobacteria bacterium]|jgi:type I restriction enzyme S subunit|nr:restriction endonuclease subunit S [Pseudomonadota bacterium]